MTALKSKVANQAGFKKVVKKKCDHTNKINVMDVKLKSKENEFLAARNELVVSLKGKEKILQQHTSAIKSLKAEAELIRRQRMNTDASVLGVDRMNELVAKLRKESAINAELSSEVKYMNNISTV